MTRILLGLSASAAIHKGADLASKLTGAGHEVTAVLTPRAAELIAPQLFEALTGRAAFVTEYGPARQSAIDHIELARATELLVISPATADFIGRLAHGLAGDLLTTLALALPADVPRFVCPAMNPHMWAKPPVQRNLELLRGDGWHVLTPDEGVMACGDEGPGRLPETPAIMAALGDHLS